jgi:hypothetical protein
MLCRGHRISGLAVLDGRTMVLLASAVPRKATTTMRPGVLRCGEGPRVAWTIGASWDEAPSPEQKSLSPQGTKAKTAHLVNCRTTHLSPNTGDGPRSHNRRHDLRVGGRCFWLSCEIAGAPTRSSSMRAFLALTAAVLHSISIGLGQLPNVL